MVGWWLFSGAFPSPLFIFIRGVFFSFLSSFLSFSLSSPTAARNFYTMGGGLVTKGYVDGCILDGRCGVGWFAGRLVSCGLLFWWGWLFVYTGLFWSIPIPRTLTQSIHSVHFAVLTWVWFSIHLGYA